MDELEAALNEMCQQVDILQAEIGTVETVLPSRTGPTGPDEYAASAFGANGQSTAKSNASGVLADGEIRHAYPPPAAPPPANLTFGEWGAGLPAPAGGNYMSPGESPMPATGKLPADPSTLFGEISPADTGLPSLLSTVEQALQDWMRGGLSMDGFESQVVSAAGQGTKPTVVALDAGTRDFSSGIDALWRALGDQSQPVMPSRTGAPGVQVGGVEIMPGEGGAVAKSNGQFGLPNTAMAQGTAAPLSEPGYGPIGELIGGTPPNASVPQPPPQVDMGTPTALQMAGPSQSPFQAIMNLATGWQNVPQHAINGGINAQQMAWQAPLTKSVASPLKACRSCKSYKAGPSGICRSCS